MRRLGLAVLDDLPAEARPRVDPRELSVGVVHLGIGAFHRAHQAIFTEDAMAASGDRCWAICGVSPRGTEVSSQLVPQDGLYALLERSADAPTGRVVGVVREVLAVAKDAEPVLDRMAAPGTGVVSLTVSEKGYRLHPSTWRLDVTDTEIIADLEGRLPRTVVGMLVNGLERRMRADAGPVTVLCCDNLPSNGAVVEHLVDDFCARLPRADRLRTWVADNVSFPSTMVDRIVPATVEADRAKAAGMLGVYDEGTVVAEPFSQWVIEDSFVARRPCWERAGAMLTDDVSPYEALKLRLLNGSHSTLAYLGAIAGYEYVADAVHTAGLAAVVHRLMTEEVLPTLDVPPGFDVTSYIESVLVRFGNPALRHRTRQVATDGSQKLEPRLLGTARDLLAAGREPRWLALSVAGWMRYVSAGCSDSGAPLTVNDPLAARIGDALVGACDPTTVVDAILGMPEIFGPELRQGIFRNLLIEWVTRLTTDGVERTLAACT